ncbi:MAG: menaquinone biosynthesis protein [Pirellulales bacterium]
MTIRIGAVSYLNTKPLIEGLEERLVAACSGGILHLDLPSHLAEQLSCGQLDIALIPSIEFFRGPELWSIVSDACIACRGPVRSVQLLFNCPPEQVQTLALDEGSRTSAALSQVMLFERFGIRPDLIPLPITADYHRCEADAVLIIGDRAMQVDSSNYVETWDLGEEWWKWTGLPFVFAMWVSGSGDISPSQQNVVEELESARDRGLAEVESIAAREATKYHLTIDDCLKYFTKQLHFRLGPDELKGLEKFKRLATKLGLTGVQSDLQELRS